MSQTYLTFLTESQARKVARDLAHETENERVLLDLIETAMTNLTLTHGLVEGRAMIEKRMRIKITSVTPRQRKVKAIPVPPNDERIFFGA